MSTKLERDKEGTKPETGRCSKLIKWTFHLEESDVVWVAIVILKSSLPKIRTKLFFSSFVNGLTSAAAERWVAGRKDKSYSAE